MDLSAWEIILYILIANAVLAGLTDTGRNIVRTIFNVKDSVSDTIVGASKAGNHVRLMELILENPEGLDKKDADGRTPLHHAAERGHLEVVTALLKAGAAINAQYFHRHWTTNRTPLHESIQGGHTDVALFLRKYWVGVRRFQPPATASRIRIMDIN